MLVDDLFENGDEDLFGASKKAKVALALQKVIDSTESKIAEIENNPDTPWQSGLLELKQTTLQGLLKIKNSLIGGGISAAVNKWAEQFYVKAYSGEPWAAELADEGLHAVSEINKHTGINLLDLYIHEQLTENDDDLFAGDRLGYHEEKQKITRARHDPQYACEYARNVKKARWPEVEDYALVKNSFWAWIYARDVIGGRWPEAEPYIMQHPAWAYEYARDVIKARWPEAEPVIAQHRSWTKDYKQHFGIKGKLSEAEDDLFAETKTEKVAKALLGYAAELKSDYETADPSWEDHWSQKRVIDKIDYAKRLADMFRSPNGMIRALNTIASNLNDRDAPMYKREAIWEADDYIQDKIGFGWAELFQTYEDQLDESTDEFAPSKRVSQDIKNSRHPFASLGVTYEDYEQLVDLIDHCSIMITVSDDDLEEMVEIFLSTLGQRYGGAAVYDVIEDIIPGRKSIHDPRTLEELRSAFEADHQQGYLKPDKAVAKLDLEMGKAMYAVEDASNEQSLKPWGRDRELDENDLDLFAKGRDNVHDLTDHDDSTVYDLTQSSENIRSGDILKLDNGRWAIMVDFYPVMVVGDSNSLHKLDSEKGHTFLNIDNGKYAGSYYKLMALANRDSINENDDDLFAERWYGDDQVQNLIRKCSTNKQIGNGIAREWLDMIPDPSAYSKKEVIDINNDYAERNDIPFKFVDWKWNAAHDELLWLLRGAVPRLNEEDDDEELFAPSTLSKHLPAILADLKYIATKMLEEPWGYLENYGYVEDADEYSNEEYDQLIDETMAAGEIYQDLTNTFRTKGIIQGVQQLDILTNSENAIVAGQAHHDIDNLNDEYGINLTQYLQEESEEDNELFARSRKGSFGEILKSRNPVSLYDWAKTYHTRIGLDGESILLNTIGNSPGYSSDYAFRYAHEVMHSPWPELEREILRIKTKLIRSKLIDGLISYAGINEDTKNFVKSIAYTWKIPKFAARFAAAFMKNQRWPDVEPLILTDPEFAISYAKYNVGGRWPEAEPVIAKNARAAGAYAAIILKARWPEAEPVIANHNVAWTMYYRDVVRAGDKTWKGNNSPTGRAERDALQSSIVTDHLLDQLTNEAIDDMFSAKSTVKIPCLVLSVHSEFVNSRSFKRIIDEAIRDGIITKILGKQSMDHGNTIDVYFTSDHENAAANLFANTDNGGDYYGLLHSTWDPIRKRPIVLDENDDLFAASNRLQDNKLLSLVKSWATGDRAQQLELEEIINDQYGFVISRLEGPYVAAGDYHDIELYDEGTGTTLYFTDRNGTVEPSTNPNYLDENQDDMFAPSKRIKTIEAIKQVLHDGYEFYMRQYNDTDAADDNVRQRIGEYVSDFDFLRNELDRGNLKAFFNGLDMVDRDVIDTIDADLAVKHKIYLHDIEDAFDPLEENDDDLFAKRTVVNPVSLARGIAQVAEEFEDRADRVSTWAAAESYRDDAAVLRFAARALGSGLRACMSELTAIEDPNSWDYLIEVLQQDFDIDLSSLYDQYENGGLTESDDMFASTSRLTKYKKVKAYLEEILNRSYEAYTDHYNDVLETSITSTYYGDRAQQVLDKITKNIDDCAYLKDKLNNNGVNGFLSSLENINYSLYNTINVDLQFYQTSLSELKDVFLPLNEEDDLFSNNSLRNRLAEFMRNFAHNCEVSASVADEEFVDDELARADAAANVAEAFEQLGLQAGIHAFIEFNEQDGDYPAEELEEEMGITLDNLIDMLPSDISESDDDLFASNDTTMRGKMIGFMKSYAKECFEFANTRRRHVVRQFRDLAPAFEEEGNQALYVADVFEKKGLEQGVREFIKFNNELNNSPREVLAHQLDIDLDDLLKLVPDQQMTESDDDLFAASKKSDLSKINSGTLIDHLHIISNDIRAEYASAHKAQATRIKQELERRGVPLPNGINENDDMFADTLSTKIGKSLIHYAEARLQILSGQLDEIKSDTTSNAPFRHKKIEYFEKQISQIPLVINVANTFKIVGMKAGLKAWKSIPIIDEKFDWADAIAGYIYAAFGIELFDLYNREIKDHIPVQENDDSEFSSKSVLTSSVEYKKRLVADTVEQLLQLNPHINSEDVRSWEEILDRLDTRGNLYHQISAIANGNNNILKRGFVSRVEQGIDTIRGDGSIVYEMVDRFAADLDKL